MERVEESRILRDYVKSYPYMAFKDLAELVKATYPDFSGSVTELALRIAKLSFNENQA